jgi:beta-lactam-binding protein with PASTA domain
MLALPVLLLLALQGCGGGGDESATVTQTVEKTTEESPPEETGSGSDTGSGGGGGGSITVPDLVGKDHQQAQDTLQADGLYNLDEEDATGQGRLLLYDRNWTVVRTDPPAGTEVSPDDTITLYSKKDGE